MSERAGRRIARTLEVLALAIVAAVGILTAGTLYPSVGTTPFDDKWIVPLVAVAGVCLARAAISVKMRVARDAVDRYRHPLAMLFAAALVWMLLAVLRPMLRAGDGLTAQYYANPTFQGAPARSAIDANPSTLQMVNRWQGNLPATFSALWTGYLVVGRDGLYGFATTSDDGSRLFIDGRLVVDNSGPHSSLTRSGSLPLSRGPHRVRLEFVEFGGGAELSWSWAYGGGPFAAVPSWALSRRSAGYGTALAARIVELALSSVAILTVLAAGWYVGVGVRGDAVRQISTEAAAVYGNLACMAVAVCIFAGILLMPWPDGHGAPFFRSIQVTLRDLNNAAVRAAGGFDTFQGNLVRPQAGEEVVGARVQDALAILRERRIERYGLSDAVAQDDWVYQQIVATAWPRRLEMDAKARVIRTGEPIAHGCTLVETRRDVSLVYCP